MRTFIAALLIVLFAGVHTAAAFGDMEMSMAAGDLSGSTEMSDADQMASSHHRKCCETSGKPGAAVKISGCSADCVSLNVDFIILQFADRPTLETVPIAAFSGGKPAPQLRPPRTV